MCTEAAAALKSTRPQYQKCKSTYGVNSYYNVQLALFQSNYDWM